MPTTKFDPQTFFQRVENVALHVPAAEVFGLFKRTLDLPGSWAAMVTKNSGDQAIVRAGAVVDGSDGEDVLFIRVTPVEAAFDEEDISTKDGFRCNATVRLHVRVTPERGELNAFAKALLGSHRVVQAGRVAAFLQPMVRSALAGVAAERDAAELVNGGASDAITDALAHAVDGPCFQAGLVLETRPVARFDSGTLRHVLHTKEQAARRRAEHEANRQLEEAIERAQSEHLDHLTSMLTQLRSLAADSPDVELPELLRTFSEQQRSELYEALFEAERPDSQTRWIVAAAGEELLFFEPDKPDSPGRRLKVTGDAGAMRSVQIGKETGGATTLLLGGQTGVYRQPINHASPDQCWVVPDAPAVRGGFNTATIVGDRIMATHSELGLWEWPIDHHAPGQPRFESLTGNANVVRFAQFFDGNVYFTVDDRVFRFPADRYEAEPEHAYTGSRSSITALCITEQGVFAGNSRGDVLRWPLDRFVAPEQLHYGSQRAAESIWVLSAKGVNRVIFTDTSLHVHARVVGDSFACRYEAGGQTLRRVEVAPDLIVATNDLRDRLFCWSPGRPAQPTAVVSVSRLCGQSVQDVCLVPRA
jgi:hypothetical protein